MFFVSGWDGLIRLLYFNVGHTASQAIIPIKSVWVGVASFNTQFFHVLSVKKVLFSRD